VGFLESLLGYDCFLHVAGEFFLNTNRGLIFKITRRRRKYSSHTRAVSKKQNSPPQAKCFLSTPWDFSNHSVGNLDHYVGMLVFTRGWRIFLKYKPQVNF
jgi:hypothetical protein